MISRLLPWLLYSLIAVFLALFVIGPLLTTLAAGLQPLYLREALSHPLHWQALLRSVLIATVTTTICLAISLPLAWLGARLRFRGQALLEGLLLAPLILPPFVGALGVFQLLGQYGVLNSVLAGLGLTTPGQGPDWLGEHRFAVICLVEALGLYPILFLSLAASLARLDPAQLDAARSLGAGPLTVWRRVVLPHLRPGAVAGGIVVWVWSFTELGTPLMLGDERALPVLVYAGLTAVQTNQLPFALVVLMMAVAGLAYGLSRFLAGPQAAALAKGGGAGLATAALTIRGARARLAALAYLLVILLATGPHLAVMVLAVSNDWYGTVLPRGLTLDRFRDALSHPNVVPGILNSALYSSLATLIAVTAGSVLAWTAVRWRPPGWRVLDAIAMLPLAVPGIVIAFGFLALVGTMQLIPGLKSVAALLDPRANPTLLLAIAYAVRRLPQVLRAVAAGLQQAPIALEEAAAACGASRAMQVRRITLPLIAGSLAAGALLTFSFSMLEVSDSLILAQQRQHWPITTVIWDLVNVLGPGPAIACAFATWSFLFLACALTAAAVFLGKSPLQVFRE